MRIRGLILVGGVLLSIWQSAEAFCDNIDPQRAQANPSTASPSASPMKVVTGPEGFFVEHAGKRYFPVFSVDGKKLLGAKSDDGEYFAAPQQSERASAPPESTGPSGLSSPDCGMDTWLNLGVFGYHIYDPVKFSDENWWASMIEEEQEKARRLAERIAQCQARFNSCMDGTTFVYEFQGNGCNGVGTAITTVNWGVGLIATLACNYANSKIKERAKSRCFEDLARCAANG